MRAVCGLGQRAAARADKDVSRVATVGGKEIAGEEVEVQTALGAGVDLDPQEILDVSLRALALRASRVIERSNLLREAPYQGLSGLPVRHEVQVLDLLADDPIGHRVDVVAYGIASQAIRFDKRRPAAHERVRHTDAFQAVGAEKRLGQRFLAEFRE
jgi:hypothetical protein